MRTLIPAVMIVLMASAAWGQTACRTVEYPDHSEAICIGDEKAVPETRQQTPAPQPAQQSQTRQPTAPVENTMTTRQTANTPVTATTAPATRAATSRRATETPGEHLARRRVLAERISANLATRKSVSPAANTQ